MTTAPGDGWQDRTYRPAPPCPGGQPSADRGGTGSRLEDQALTRGEQKDLGTTSRGERIEGTLLLDEWLVAVVVEDHDRTRNESRPEILGGRDLGDNRLHVDGQVADLWRRHLRECVRDRPADEDDVTKRAKRFLHVIEAL